MALVAHTFRIEPETLDRLKRLGNGNESLGCRIAIDQAGQRNASTFCWGVVAGALVSAIAHIILRSVFT